MVAGRRPEDLQALLATYHHPEIRDLIWSLLSPSLLHPLSEEKPLLCDAVWGAEVYSSTEDWFREQDREGNLGTFLSDRSAPLLGLYFERLLEFLFETHPFFELKGHSLQIMGEGRTLGELDFIFVDRRSSLTYHLECAIKYYLYHPQYKDWFGPGPNDRLEDKAHKMIKVQAAMAKTYGGQELLSKLGVGDTVPLVLLKGYLFYPFADWQTHKWQLPSGINDAHLRGWWLLREGLEELNGTAFRLLHKPDWLTPVVEPSEEILNKEEFIQRCEQFFARGRRDVFAAVLERRGDGWHESSRGFVLNTGWPERYMKK